MISDMLYFYWYAGGGFNAYKIFNGYSSLNPQISVSNGTITVKTSSAATITIIAFAG